MAFVVVWRMWGWNPLAAAALIVPFVCLDMTFLAANLLKVAEGGWISLFVGGMLIIVMVTWRRGARLLFEKTRKQEVPLIDLVKISKRSQSIACPGTAVFFTSDPESAPTALLHSLKHYKVLHEENVILTPRDRRNAAGEPGRARDDGLHQQDLRAHHDPLRLHGKSERAEGAFAARRNSAGSSTS